MKKRPLTTISISTLSVVITLAASLFDKSIYAIDGNPISWMGFNPALPFRHMGIGIISSPFIHISTEHLLVNLFFFIPIAMMIERVKGGALLALLFISTHLLVLTALTLISLYYPLEAKSFLGSSHIIVGLYSFWFLKKKNYLLFATTLFILGAGLWQSQSPFTTLAHGLGFIVGIVTLFLNRLINVLRSKSANSSKIV